MRGSWGSASSGWYPPVRPFSETGPGCGALVSDGFMEAVRGGRVHVRQAVVDELVVDDARPAVRLRDGRVLPADLVVTGTGFEQDVPFFPDDVRARLRDARGAFRLYRTVLPLDVPDLSFIGYNQPLLSCLSVEAAALWLVGLLSGRFTLPSLPVRRTEVDESGCVGATRRRRGTTAPARTSRPRPCTTSTSCSTTSASTCPRSPARGSGWSPSTRPTTVTCSRCWRPGSGAPGGRCTEPRASGRPAAVGVEGRAGVRRSAVHG